MLDPSAINPLALPSVPLEMRSLLPKTSCIYFAIDSQGIVQYVGKAVNVKARWAGHHKYQELSKMDGIRIAYLQLSDASLLLPVESALIEWFKPYLNRADKLNPYSSGMLEIRLRVGKRAEEIAVELGVAVSTVRNWDQLKTAPRMTPMGLQKLMRVYQCTFDELVQAEREVNDVKA